MLCHSVPAMQVVQRVPLGLPPGPVHLAMAHGRLVLLHSEGIAAFNLSSHKVQLPGSYLVSHTWQQLWRLYGLSQQHQQLLANNFDSSSDTPEVLKLDGLEAGSSSSSDSDFAAKPDTSSSDSSSSNAAGVLHTPAWDTPLTAAAATHGLLMLPFGSRGMATFTIGQGAGGAAGSWAAAAGGAGSGGGSVRNSSGGGGAEVNWVKVLQPFVVIMMIIVGVWQFIRASNKSSRLASSTRRAGRYGAGLGGVPDMEDLLSRSQGLAGAYMMQDDLNGVQRRPGWGLDDEDGGLGSFRTLDRDFGPYAGPRGRRGEGHDQAGGGPLGALTARRRARAAMFGSRQAEREQQGVRQRGVTGGQGGRRQGEVRRGAGGVQGRVPGRVNGSIAEGQEEGYSEEDVVLLQQQEQQQEQHQQDGDVDAAELDDNLLEAVLQQASLQQQQVYADGGAAVSEGEGEASLVLQQATQQQQQQQLHGDLGAAVLRGDGAVLKSGDAASDVLQQERQHADVVEAVSEGGDVTATVLQQASQRQQQQQLQAGVGKAGREGEDAASAVSQQASPKQQHAGVDAAVSDTEDVTSTQLQQQQQPQPVEGAAEGSKAVVAASAEVQQATQKQQQLEPESSAASSRA